MSAWHGFMKTEYQKLPGRGRRNEGFVSVVRLQSKLWLGEDHLLCVDSQGYSEDYKRFYYRDIQAIIIRKTRGQQIVLLVWGILAGLSGLLGFATARDWRILWWSLGGVALFVFLVTAIAGQTCICHLKTAVQQEELPAWKRLRPTRKGFALLKARIDVAQGTVPGNPASTAAMANAEPGPPVDSPPGTA